MLQSNSPGGGRKDWCELNPENEEFCWHGDSRFHSWKYVREKTSITWNLGEIFQDESGVLKDHDTQKAESQVFSSSFRTSRHKKGHRCHLTVVTDFFMSCGLGMEQPVNSYEISSILFNRLSKCGIQHVFFQNWSFSSTNAHRFLAILSYGALAKRWN